MKLNKALHRPLEPEEESIVYIQDNPEDAYWEIEDMAKLIRSLELDNTELRANPPTKKGMAKKWKEVIKKEASLKTRENWLNRRESELNHRIETVESSETGIDIQNKELQAFQFELSAKRDKTITLIDELDRLRVIWQDIYKPDKISIAVRVLEHEKVELDINISRLGKISNDMAKSLDEKIQALRPVPKIKITTRRFRD